MTKVWIPRWPVASCRKCAASIQLSAVFLPSQPGLAPAPGSVAHSRPAARPPLARGTRAFPGPLPPGDKRSAARSHNRGLVHSAAGMRCPERVGCFHCEAVGDNCATIAAATFLIRVHYKDTALRPDRAPQLSVGSARLCERNPTYRNRSFTRLSSRMSPPLRHMQLDAAVQIRVASSGRFGRHCPD